MRESLNAAVEAQNDQEISAGVEWMESMNPSILKVFFDAINDASGRDLAKLKSPELAAVRNLALIGFSVVAVARARKAGAQ